jgi:hypothetical protein
MAECFFIYIEDTNSCGEAPNEALMKILKGDTGNGIASIIQTSISEDELEKTYTITYTDGNEFEYIVKDGNSILSIEYIGISADGLQKTYQVNYQDGTTFQYVVNQGVGIKTITKTSTTLLTDTYTITFANNFTTTFNVKNGNGIESIAKTNTNVLVDTYTITFTDTTTTTFDVTNAKSITNIEFVSTNLLTDIYKINFNDNTNILFNVANGRGITNISYISTNGLVDTYRITYNDNATSDFIVTNGQGYNNKGDWDGITTYKPFDVVKYLNSVYVCLVGNTNNAPSLSNTDWVVWIDSSAFDLVLEEIDDKIIEVNDKILEADEVINNPPIMNDSTGYWQVWNKELEIYEDTPYKAFGGVHYTTFEVNLDNGQLIATRDEQLNNTTFTLDAQGQLILAINN